MKFVLKRLILISAAILTLTNPNCLADVASRIKRVIGDPSQKKVDFAVKIINADTAAPVYSYYPDKPMIPASNMKLVTTAAAIDLLGHDFKFITKVGISGRDIVIIGSGDPLFADEKTDLKYARPQGWILNTIAEKLEELQISSIENIIVDSTIFDDKRVHPSWPKDQINKWYACEVSGINYNDNCIEMMTKKNKGRVDIIIDPKTNFISVVNKVRPITSGNGAVGAYRTQTQNKLLVKGKCKKQQGPFLVAIERPSLLFGYLLFEKLTQKGITVTGKLQEKAFEKVQFRSVTQFSTELTDCLQRANKNSLGLVAESLLKAIAAKYSNGKNGSWKSGAIVISKYLEGLGIDQVQFNIDDGSGLSRKNKLSPNAITTIVLNQYNSSNWQLYKDSLAVGGKDGTIKKYFYQQQYKSRVLGKTGYIAGVKSFSGFCQTDKGNYIFAIITNNANGKTRKAINDIVKALFGS